MEHFYPSQRWSSFNFTTEDACKPFFAFGHDDSYVFSMGAGHKTIRLIGYEGLSRLFEGRRVLFVAFGPLEVCWFAVFEDMYDGESHLYHGPGVPAAFKAWLRQDDGGAVKRSKFTRVAFGPNESFIAWDSDAIRWSNIPPGLESVIQGWLGRTGWTKGFPRTVALGVDGSFFAVSDYGTWAYKGVPRHLVDGMRESWQGIGDVQHVALSCFAPHYIALFGDGRMYCYSVPESMSFNNFFDFIDGPQNPISRSTRRDLLQLAWPRSVSISEAWRYDQAHREQARRKMADLDDTLARDLLARLLQETSKPSLDVRREYHEWNRRCDAKLTQNTFQAADVAEFPFLPLALITCKQEDCRAQRESPCSIGACKHDVKFLLQGCGAYNAKWLKSERVRWHPDKLSGKCDGELREKLHKKAAEMFSILTELLDEELGKTE